MGPHSGGAHRRGGIAETGQIDSSYGKAHRCSGGAKSGARAQAIGISRGGRTTKIHALVDFIGRPLRLALSPWNTSDIKGADLRVCETVGMRRLLADRGYDANRLRAKLCEQGAIPVISGRRNRKRRIQYDERRYKDRWRVEAMFWRLKDFRRVATRYDKLSRNYLSAVALAAAIAFWLRISLDPNKYSYNKIQLYKSPCENYVIKGGKYSIYKQRNVNSVNFGILRYLKA